MNLQVVIDSAVHCHSWSSLYRKVTGYGDPNARTLKKFREKFQDHVDTNHFTKNGRKLLPRVTKECPVCGNMFECVVGSRKTSTTCSVSCSNTHFNTGVYRGDSYRSICFTHHDKKCIVCEEDKIVHVHHYDEDHENNDPANLVPLCPTHHQYCHSRHKHLIEKDVDEYVEKFKMSGSSSAVE